VAVYRLFWPSTDYFKGIINFKGFTAFYWCWGLFPFALLFSSPIICGPRKENINPPKKLEKTQNVQKKLIEIVTREREKADSHIFFLF
jgi:hypothetical protein